MPYQSIDELPPEVRDRLSAGEQRQWLAVFNEVLAETGDEAKAFAAAWGAVQKARLTRVSIKAAPEDGAAVVEGWGLLFTDEAAPDITDEFFSHATELLLEYYDSGPLWYEHRTDPAYGEDPIGKRVALTAYPRGLWVEHRLDPDHPLYARTVREVEAGELAYSSDTAAQLMERIAHPEAVEITRWPIIGWSLVHEPAEPALGPVALKAFANALKAATGQRAAGTRAEAQDRGDDAANANDAEPVAAQAREAQSGDAAAAPVGDGPTSTDTPAATGDTHRGGKQAMNEELLNALAQALGVEATQTAVTQAMTDLIGQIDPDAPATEEMKEGAAALEVDLPALRAALGLAEDADEAAIAEALSMVLALLQEPVEPEPAMSAGGEAGSAASAGAPPAKTIDYAALRRAREAAAKRAEAAVSDGLPYLVPAQGSAPGAGKRRGAPALVRGARPARTST